jgi:hypothetical protein
MVQLSPILPLIQGKYERRTDRLPAFYLAETIHGVRGIIGATGPKALTRVQSPSNGAIHNSKSWDELLQGVYWSESPLPTNIAEFSKGPGVSPIPSTLQTELNNYLSHATTCLVGDESKLEEAIAAGVPSVPVVFWDAQCPKLPWVPCHRVIRRVKGFQSGWMVCLAREHLFFRDITSQLSITADNDNSFDVKSAAEQLAPRDNEAVTILAFTRDGAWRIHSEPGWADGLLQHLHPLLRELAVVQLHHIVLPRGLDLPPDDGSQDSRVEVVHSVQKAVASIRDGAHAAYLLNPIRSSQLKELVKQKQMLPANSAALDVAALEVWKNAD